jgi:hypothetical protein
MAAQTATPLRAYVSDTLGELQVLSSQMSELERAATDQDAVWLQRMQTRAQHLHALQVMQEEQFAHQASATEFQWQQQVQQQQLLWSQYHQQLDEYQRQIQTIRESQPPVVDTSEVLPPPLPPVIALPSEPTVLSLEARLRELHHERMTMDLLLETSDPYERAEIHRDLSPHVSAPVLSRVTSATARACEIVDRQRIATLLAIEQAQAPRLLASSLKAAAAAHVTPIVPPKASPAPLTAAAPAAPAAPADQPVPAPGPGNPPSKKERPQMAPSQNMQPPLAAIVTEKPKTYVTCCPANCMFRGFYFVFVLLFSLVIIFLLQLWCD